MSLTNTILTTIMTWLVITSDRVPYFFVIKKWAKIFNLRIVYTSRYTDCFECDLDEKVLYISKYNKAVHNKQEYIASVAHEIGHLIGAAVDEGYTEKHQISRRLTKKAIYLDESRAWKIAQLLLEDAKIYDSNTFIPLQDRCLLEYKKALYARRSSR